KRITSIAMAGDPLVLIDNVTGPFGSEALESLLTTTQWSDRVLGGQTMFVGNVSAFWLVTGNNLNFARHDMLRRVMHVRLQSSHEHPEQRSTFRRPKLLEAVESQRGDLTMAALTIVAAYCAAGRPSQSLEPWGSFEGWSNLVRSAVVWCGLDDPAAGRRELATVADTATLGLAALLSAWQTACIATGDDGFTAAKALDFASPISLFGRTPEGTALREAILELCPSPANQLPNTARLGTKLRSVRERIAHGLTFTSKMVRGNNVWRVVKPRPPDDDVVDVVDVASSAAPEPNLDHERMQGSRAGGESVPDVPHAHHVHHTHPTEGDGEEDAAAADDPDELEPTEDGVFPLHPPLVPIRVPRSMLVAATAVVGRSRA
ncbi:MAG TPA: hypothetical protein VK745_31945, partial [Polyangiaceae bacterium]|nr:hypothetical protein [Polyangiaceae bacterium]